MLWKKSGILISKRKLSKTIQDKTEGKWQAMLITRSMKLQLGNNDWFLKRQKFVEADSAKKRMKSGVPRQQTYWRVPTFIKL